MNKERLKGIMIGGIIVGSISLGLNPAIGQSFNKTINAAFNSVNIVLDGQSVDADNIAYNGTTYVPMRKMAEMMGKEVNWNQSTNTATIGKMNNGSLVYTDAKYFKMDYNKGFITDYNEKNKYTNAPTKVIIPKTINGALRPELVQGIDKRSFSRRELTEVILPEGITHIEENAFYVNNLTTITIPDSVVYIGSSAFKENDLTQVIVPLDADISSFAFDRDVKVIRK